MYKNCAWRNALTLLLGISCSPLYVPLWQNAAPADLSLEQFGGNSTTVNKLLELIDGRTVYTMLGRQLTPDIELSPVMQNIFDAPRHAEWGFVANRPEFERSVLLKMAWRP